MKYTTWQQRVIDEKSELEEKCAKLYEFFDSEAFNCLGKEDQILLIEQRCHMWAYSNVLMQRIARFQT